MDSLISTKLAEHYDIDNFWHDNGDAALVNLLDYPSIVKVSQYKIAGITEDCKNAVNMEMGSEENKRVETRLNAVSVKAINFILQKYRIVVDQFGNKYLRGICEDELVPLELKNVALCNLCTRMGVNGATKYYQHLIAELTSRKDTSNIVIAKISHYRNGQVYLQTPDNQIWLITQDSIAPVNQIDIDIVFVKHDTNQLIPKFDLTQPANGVDFVSIMLKGINFDPSILSQDEWKLVFSTLLVAFTLRDMSRSLLPLVLFTGENNCGKTTIASILKGFFLGYSDKFPPLANMPNQIRSLASLIQNDPLVVADNVDTVVKPSIIDMLALVTTGAPYKSRKLFTDTDEVAVNLDGLFAITTTNNPLSRQDLQQRSMEFVLKELDKTQRVSDLQLINRIRVQHPQMMVEFAHRLQAALRTLKAMTDSNFLLPMCDFRKLDFVSIAIAYAGDIEHADRIVDIFNKYTRSQIKIRMSENTEIGILYAAYVDHKHDFINGMTAEQMIKNLTEWKYSVARLEKHQKIKTFLRNDLTLRQIFCVTKQELRNKGVGSYQLILWEDVAFSQIRAAIEADINKCPAIYSAGISKEQLVTRMQANKVHPTVLKKFDVVEFIENNKDRFKNIIVSHVDNRYFIHINMRTLSEIAIDNYKYPDNEISLENLVLVED